jgi:ParB/RepB/Spo0J family partition protein
MRLPLSCLGVSSLNIRQYRTDARIDALAESLREDGQQEPIVVYAGKEAHAGSYWIVSGVTRYLAAQRLGWEALAAREDETLDAGDTLALVKASRLYNDTRQETELDHALMARQLREAGYTRTQIAHTLGYKSEHIVSRLKTFFELPEALLTEGITHAEKFSTSLSRILKKAVHDIGEDKTRVILKRVFAENLSRRETERLIRAEELSQQRAAGLRPWPVQVTDIHLEGDKIGRLNVWEIPGQQHKIQFSATLDKVAGTQFVAQLNTFLKSFVDERESRVEDA